MKEDKKIELRIKRKRKYIYMFNLYRLKYL